MVSEPSIQILAVIVPIDNKASTTASPLEQYFGPSIYVLQSNNSVDAYGSPLFLQAKITENLSVVLIKLSQSNVSRNSWSRSVRSLGIALVNPLFATFNRSSWSRSVENTSTVLVNPQFMTANNSTWSRSMKVNNNSWSRSMKMNINSWSRSVKTSWSTWSRSMKNYSRWSRSMQINWSTWSRSMRAAFKLRNTLEIIDEIVSVPASNHLQHAACERCKFLGMDLMLEQ